MIMEFNWHAVNLGWVIPQETFSKFKSLLQGGAVSVWKVLIHDDVNQDMEAGFSKAIQHLTLKKNIGGMALANQQHYLQNVRKPKEMLVEDFCNPIQYINLFLREIFSATTADMLEETKLKNIIFYTMPKGWHGTFIDSGQDVMAKSLEDIERYMTNQEMKFH